MISRRRLFAMGGAAAVAPMLPSLPRYHTGGYVTGEAPLILSLGYPSIDAYRRRMIEEALNSPAMKAFMKAEEDRILYGDPNESHPFDGLAPQGVDSADPVG